MLSRSLASTVPFMTDVLCVFLTSVENQITNNLLLMNNDYWAGRDLEKEVFLGSSKRHPLSGPLLWPLIKMLLVP